jgi:hypothetical protein
MEIYGKMSVYSVLLVWSSLMEGVIKNVGLIRFIVILFVIASMDLEESERSVLMLQIKHVETTKFIAALLKNVCALKNVMT